MPTMQGTCWHCGRALEGADYGRENRCPGCDKPTYVCRNCRFYAPGRPNDCMEPLVERVTDKERANFCDYFEAVRRQPQEASPAAADLRKAAEDLFK